MKNYTPHLFNDVQEENLPVHFRYLRQNRIDSLLELRHSKRFSRNSLHPTRSYMNYLPYKPVAAADYDTLFQTALNHD
jgi:hypothetical protein